MFFNSLTFAVFLPIVFVLYWFVFSKTKTAQNAFLVLVSYYFYSCWDWRFTFLLLFSTLLCYFTGIQIEKSKQESNRKFWFWLSIIFNLGFLALFKYYNFFTTSFAEALNTIGIKSSPLLLDVILPVGISFYTFHGLSYVIDIYYKRIESEKNVVDYALFVSYFPLLVAGPIERATHLLPQVKLKRSFDFEKAKEGIYQFIWGLVKKVVIADTCATYANAIFDNYTSMNSLSLILGAIYFAFQIYGDFSSYSDMALGMSKLFGLDLLRNFNYPYFSRDIAEFWRRWHISLSSWFRDYLYIPLGGSRGSKFKQVRNVFIIFVVSGFWHGASWTFVAWGFINALYFLPSLLLGTNRTNMETAELHWDFNSIKVFVSMLATFSITCLAWIFFRANSIEIAFDYIQKMVGNGKFDSQFLQNQRYNYELILLVLAFILIEWNSRYKIEPISGKYSWLKMTLCLLVIIALGTYSDYKEFIYFQF
ncbi:MAG: MBOAT family protein [Flavobacterium sp.]|nr:MBOAT family protein [Flavobacterium sp.]